MVLDYTTQGGRPVSASIHVVSTAMRLVTSALLTSSVRGIVMTPGRRDKLQRKNVIIDAAKVRQLRRKLRATSESSAIRTAVDRAFASEEAMAALERIRRRGTLGKRLA